MIALEQQDGAAVALLAHNQKVGGSNPPPAPNSKSKGEISEGVILGVLLRKGFTVLLPFGNNQRYDLVYDAGRGFVKCQCKTGRLRNGRVEFNSCSINGFTGKRRTYRGEIDLFLVFCPDTDRVYSVPVRDCGVSVTALRVDPSPTGRRGGQPRRWAKDYEL